VTSGIDGVVTKISSSSGNEYYSDSGSDDAYITIKKVGDFRVKASINELNMNDIYEGAPMIVTSRMDGTTWTGTISEIQTNEPASGG